MVNIGLMSDNLALIISEIVRIQEVVKYISYDQPDSQSQPDVVVPANNLILNKVFPYPFNQNAETIDCTQVRVYFPDGILDASGYVAQTSLFFDVIVAKSLWLINDGKSGIRPYMVLHHLVKHFGGKSIGTVGKLHFTNFIHLNVNDKFDAIRVHAQMGIFGGA